MNKLLLESLPNLTYGLFCNTLRKKDIKINGKRVNKDVTVFEGDEVEVLRPDVPYFKIKLEDMYDLDKNKKTDVANRAHMMFKVKVNELLKVNDMLVKANNTININNN